MKQRQGTSSRQRTFHGRIYSKPVRSQHLDPSFHADADVVLSLETVETTAASTSMIESIYRGAGSLPLPYQRLPCDGAATDRSGFFFESRPDLVHKLCSRRSEPAVTAVINSLPVGPDYRYAVEDGRVVDMLRVKQEVPTTFEHVALVSHEQRMPPDARVHKGAQVGETSHRTGNLLRNGDSDDDVLSDGESYTPQAMIKPEA